ncbi:thiamine-phosphate synthase [Sporosarcina sp. NCCP-2716]|nr:thiamine-phosphate synthase [Sporosarcina sp. NCCP-2716]
MESIDLGLYFIMGTKDVRSGNPLAVLESALRGGATLFQLREKGPGALEGEEKFAFAKSCQRLCQVFDVPFIVNDDVDLALAVDADGIHVGQDDWDAARVRKRLGPDRILGVSVHTVAEAEAAIAAGANYVGMGPVFGTRSKPNARTAAGTVGIREVAARFPELPIVAIGGITAGAMAEILASGAQGAAVISAIAGAGDAEQAAAEFVAALGRPEAVMR